MARNDDFWLIQDCEIFEWHLQSNHDTIAQNCFCERNTSLRHRNYSLEGKTSQVPPEWFFRLKHDTEASKWLFRSLYDASAWDDEMEFELCPLANAISPKWARRDRVENRVFDQRAVNHAINSHQQLELRRDHCFPPILWQRSFSGLRHKLCIVMRR
jgi:hypothetical protein